MTRLPLASSRKGESSSQNGANISSGAAEDRNADWGKNLKGSRRSRIATGGSSTRRRRRPSGGRPPRQPRVCSQSDSVGGGVLELLPEPINDQGRITRLEVRPHTIDSLESSMSTDMPHDQHGCFIGARTAAR